MAKNYRNYLDRTDIRILRHVALNGRAGIRSLAREMGRSPSTISERLRRLESLGLIKGYTALLNYNRLGYEINALILIQVDGKFIEELEKDLSREPNVRAVYDITGDYDVAIIVSFKSVRQLDSFVKSLIKKPPVKRSMTSLVFRVVKEDPHIKEFLEGKTGFYEG